MHFISTIKEFLLDKEEYLILFNNYAHIYGLEKIQTLEENIIIVKTKKRDLIIKGSKMKIIKMTKEELLIEGNIESVSLNA